MTKLSQSVWSKKNIKRLSSLSAKNITLGRGNNKKIITNTLKDLLNTPERDDISVIETTILVVYGIRNSLVHGDYVPDSEETDTIIGLAEQLISEILREVIGKLVIGKSLEGTSFIGVEKAGIG